MEYQVQKHSQSQITVDILLGEQDIKGKSNEEAAKNAFAEAIRQEKLLILTPPIYDFDQENPQKFTVTFTTYPEVQIPDYKTLKPSQTEPKPVTDEDIEIALNASARQMAKPTKVEREAKKGDLVLVNYEARDTENVLQMGGKNQKFFLGYGELLPELEEKILGSKPGSTLNFEVTFPSDYFKADLQKQKLQFKVDILEIHELELPKTDDALAVLMLGEGKTLTDLKETIRDQLTKKREADATNHAQNDFMGALIEQTKVELPAALVDDELKFMHASMEAAAKEKGEEAPEPNLEQLTKLARKNVILRLALDQIFRLPEFTISDQEIQAVLDLEISHRTEEEKQKVREELASNPNLSLNLRRQLQLQKLLQIVLEK